MRGLLLPSLPGVIDWEHALTSMSDPHPTRFLEALIMGGKRDVYAHLIVPTCFSIMMDDKRHEALEAVIQTQDALNACVLLRQDDVMTSCAACLEPVIVTLEEGGPWVHRQYQVALHIIGALESTTSWTFDVCMGILCRDCQTTVWRNSLLISEADYTSIARGITDLGFSDAISVDQFMDVKRYGPDPRMITCMGLIDSYLYRLERINKFYVKDFLQLVQTDEDDALVCYHCKRAHHELVVPCKTCGLVWFCNRPSNDHRFGRNKTCMELGAIYHGPACREIREREIFHIAEAWYVDRRDYATVHCFDED